MSLRNNIWEKFRWKWYLGRKETSSKSYLTEDYLVNLETRRWLIWPEQSGQRGKDTGDDVICVRWAHLPFSLPCSFVYFGYSLHIYVKAIYIHAFEHHPFYLNIIFFTQGLILLILVPIMHSIFIILMK